MNFDSDNLFLVKEFEKSIAGLPKNIIDEAKSNGSYYNFYCKTSTHIIVPKDINFTFKYFHLIAEDNPEYFDRVIAGWNKVLHPEFGDPFDATEKNKVISTFDDIYNNDKFDILPPKQIITDKCIWFKNVESIAEPLELKMTVAHKFKTLYDSAIPHVWRNKITIKLFPVNDISYYGMVNGRLTLLYPIWNSYRWSVETPAYIIDERTPLKVLQYKKFDVNTEQISIRMMNGQLPKELFI